MVNIKSLNPNKIKVYGKSYKNIHIYQVGYMTVNNLSYVKINSVNSLYFVIDKINGNIEENNGNNSADESKETMKNIKNSGAKS